MGIQISNLLQDAAFDWKSVVDQLVEVQRSATVKPVEADIAKNDSETAALTELGGLLDTLQASVQALREDDVFSLRTVSASSSTTWTSVSSSGAAVGAYTFNVSQLATQARLVGGSDIGAPLHTSADVSGLTVANLRTASAVTAGVFTVNGRQVAVSTTDSLEDVFAAISTATGGAVTASYDAAGDKVRLSGPGEIVLGAANDTSNFLAVMKLANNGSGEVASSARLGTVRTTATLAGAGLASPVSGAGSFAINGVSISYDTATDSLTSLVSRINRSSAGVTAAYDAANDRFTLTNNATGDLGLGVTDDANGLLAALGLTAGAGASLARGRNALFSVNGGDTFTSTSNTLSESVHGIGGLSVTVNSATEQTLQVESDAATMQKYVSDFVDAFNAVQGFIAESTKIAISGTDVTTSVLSGNREVEGWNSRLRALAFDAVSGLAGTVDRLNDLGIDFDGTSDQLRIFDSEALTSALTERPQDVSEFFLAPTTGFVSRLYTALSTIKSANRSQQSRMAAETDDLNEQLERLQARLDNERELLTSAFLRMQDAQSAASSQAKTLENAFFRDSGN